MHADGTYHLKYEDGDWDGQHTAITIEIFTSQIEPFRARTCERHYRGLRCTQEREKRMTGVGAQVRPKNRVSPFGLTPRRGHDKAIA